MGHRRQPNCSTATRAWPTSPRAARRARQGRHRARGRRDAGARRAVQLRGLRAQRHGAAGDRRRARLRASTSTCARSSGPSRRCCRACCARRRARQHHQHGQRVLAASRACRTASSTAPPRRRCSASPRAWPPTTWPRASAAMRSAPARSTRPRCGDRINANADPVAARKAFIARQPMGRLAQAEEIAPLVVFLASDESRVRHRPGLRGRRRHHDMNQLDFEGRHAVVTGGATGLGFAIAQRLLASRRQRHAVGPRRRAAQQGRAALGAKALASRSTWRSSRRCAQGRAGHAARSGAAHRCAGQQRRHHRPEHASCGTTRSTPGGR